jgi:hypothetical protein
MRKSSPGLWPRDNHVEEQATECHTDSERIGQLAHTSFSKGFSFRDRNVA